jgi:TonB family protein
LYYSCGKTSKLIKNDQPLDIMPPVLLQKEELSYPDKALKYGLEGVVGLYIYVTEEGQVSKTKISAASGIKFLDEAAEEYAQKLKYKPAEQDGKPVGVWLTMDINFDLINKEKSFDINAYLRKISRQQAALESSRGELNSLVLQDLIETYQEYINYVRGDQPSNYYKEISLVLDKKTIAYWKNYLDWWPLTFILYYDFIIRFPESEYLPTAIEKMVILIREDVKRIIQLSKDHDYPSGKISNLFKAIYLFLEEIYQDHLDDSLKSDLQIYKE